MPLTAWANFYVIVGSSAAALTGLMFVAVSLIPDAGTSATGESIPAFGTPTVVHFCAALLLSVVLCVPWTGLAQAAICVGLIGGAGLGYLVVVVRRARRQSEYQPVFSDWLWHTLLPFAGYATLVVSALLLARTPGALFGLGAATVLLLYIGIHNAWDTVTFIAVLRLQAKSRPGDRPSPGSEAPPNAPVNDAPDAPTSPAPESPTPDH